MKQKLKYIKNINIVIILYHMYQTVPPIKTEVKDMSKVLDYMIRKYKIEWTINIEDIDKCVCFIHEPNDNCIRVNMFLNSFDQIEPMKEKALHHIKTGKMCEGRIQI